MRLCNLPQVTHSDGAGGHQQSIIQSAVIVRQDKINGLKRIRKKKKFLFLTFAQNSEKQALILLPAVISPAV